MPKKLSKLVIAAVCVTLLSCGCNCLLTAECVFTKVLPAASIPITVLYVTIVIGLLTLPATVSALILGHLVFSRQTGTGPRHTRTAIYELVFVSFVLLPLLCALTAPNFLHGKDHVHRLQCKDNMKQIDKAVRLARSVGIMCVTSVSELVPTYIREEPHCPNAPDKSYIITNDTVVCPAVYGFPPHRLR